MSLTCLPAETIEAILIHTAIAGFPAAIAAFSQTCRAHHALVYKSADHHLWREIYLSTYDDPRELRFNDTGESAFNHSRRLEMFPWVYAARFVLERLRVDVMMTVACRNSRIAEFALFTFLNCAWLSQSVRVQVS